MTSDADDLPRLSKRMGELGLCSRREAEAWIVAGWVKVDGQVVDVLGTRVSREARIEVDRRARAQQAELVTVLLNKPIGYVSGQAQVSAATVDEEAPRTRRVSGGREAQGRGVWSEDRCKVDSRHLATSEFNFSIARSE